MAEPSSTRTYGQFCPVAAGLDLVGDRWVLLICRELLHQPRGFNEIKRALPGLASNLLSTRLRTMAGHGMVEVADGGRYRLTDEGKRVAPVLRAVARFGVRAVDDTVPEGREPEAVDARRLARGFLLPWLSARATSGRLRVQAPDGSAIDLVVDADGAALNEPHGDPDVTLYVDAPNLLAVRRGTGEFTGRAEGRRAATARWLRALDLPAPAAPSATN